MHSPELKASVPPLTLDLNLPVFTEPMREHWPSAMTWVDAVRHFNTFRERYMRDFDSPEQRLRDKNPKPFRLP